MDRLQHGTPPPKNITEMNPGGICRQPRRLRLGRPQRGNASKASPIAGPVAHVEIAGRLPSSQGVSATTSVDGPAFR
jgi:hypothetical protein